MARIHEVLESARKGEEGHAIEIKKYLISFQHIVLRGAGRFGNALGAYLLAQGIPRVTLSYWDIRASELKQVNGIEVRDPFSDEYDRAHTLIINCIPNGSLSGNIGEEAFIEHGYRFYVFGMALYEALMCRLKPEADFDPGICIDTTVCNWCTCKRLPSLLHRHCRALHSSNFSDELTLNVATFVINQKCTLKCKHCGQYMNSYLPADRINFSLDRIKRDIDRIFAAVDAIGFVSIIGGEPFLHPDLNDIIDYVLEKSNFGVLGITTNGICDISRRHLDKLKNRRTRLVFSDYTQSLSGAQRDVFGKNLKRACESGISYTVGKPLWWSTAPLRKRGLSEAERTGMKACCNSRNTCKTIQNGIFYPCSTSANIGSHHFADYPHDWVRIDETHSTAELRRRLIQLGELSYFESCDYCGEGGQILPFPGEQELR
jgi:hypothetical protein